MPYVVSTQTNDVEYNVWTKAFDGDTPSVAKAILIKGGCGRVNPLTQQVEGPVLTEVSDADVALLKANHVFQIHEKAGFVQITSRNSDKAAADMNDSQPDAQLTEKTLAGRGGKTKPGSAE